MTWACPTCAFALYLPLDIKLSTSHAGLYSDSRFPGRTIVAYDTHVEHLEDLSDSGVQALWADAIRVGRAVKAVTGAARINYAVLGNGSPHLHIHVIPRSPAVEPLPTRPPWNDPRDLNDLAPAQVQRLSVSIQAAAGRTP